MNLAFAGIVMGFLGSSHCVAMCGGLAGALPSATARAAAGNLRRTVLYNAGRIASYTVAGVAAGSLGAAFAGAGGAAGILVLRGLSALLVIGVGLYVAGWSNLVVHVERIGGVLWRRIAPAARRARASDSPAANFLFGAMWGWLPCGLVYSALAVAASSGSGATGALVMAGFGLGTLPAMTAIGLAAGRFGSLLRGRAMRQLAGAMVVVFGLWTFAAAATASVRLRSAPSCHSAAPENSARAAS